MFSFSPPRVPYFLIFSSLVLRQVCVSARISLRLSFFSFCVVLSNFFFRRVLKLCETLNNLVLDIFLILFLSLFPSLFVSLLYNKERAFLSIHQRRFCETLRFIAFFFFNNFTQ